MRKRKNIFDDLEEARIRLEKQKFVADMLDQAIPIAQNAYIRPLAPQDVRPEEDEPAAETELAPSHASDKGLAPSRMSDKEFVQYVRETILDEIDQNTLRSFTQTLAKRALAGEYVWARLFLRMLLWLVPTVAVEQLETPKGVAIVIENYGEGGKTERNTLVV